MTGFRLMGENPSIPRPCDLLVQDHPNRPYPVVHRVRTSAIVRAAVFLAIFYGIGMVWTYVDFVLGGTSEARYALSQILSAVIAYAVVTLGIEGRRRPYEIQPRRLLGLFRGMVLGGGIIAACVGVLALLGSYSFTGFNPDYSPWIDILFLGVVAGITEEVQMRGVLFRLMEEGLGTWGAVAVSATVFGWTHLSNPDANLWGAIAIALEAGVLLAAVYALTRSLWWCIGVHFAWNVVEGPVFGSIVSATGFQDSWLIGSWTGPQILTGGRFGMEASIVPVILSGGLGVALLVYAWHRGLMVDPIWVRKRKLTEREGIDAQKLVI